MRIARVVWMVGAVLMLTVPTFAAVKEAGTTDGYASAAEIAALRKQAGKAERQSHTALSAARKASAKARHATAIAKKAKSRIEEVSGRQKTDREWLKILYQGNSDDPSNPAAGTGLIAAHSRAIRDVRATIDAQKTRIDLLEAKNAHIWWWIYATAAGAALALVIAILTLFVLRQAASEAGDEGEEPGAGEGELDFDAARPAPEGV